MPARHSAILLMVFTGVQLNFYITHHLPFLFLLYAQLVKSSKEMICKHRTVIVLVTAIPLSLFLVWNAVILGTITGLETNTNKITNPLQLLRSTNGTVGLRCSRFLRLELHTLDLYWAFLTSLQIIYFK